MEDCFSHAQRPMPCQHKQFLLKVTHQLSRGFESGQPREVMLRAEETWISRIVPKYHRSDTASQGRLLKEDKTISDYLPDEDEYPELADFLRSGGLLEIVESREMGSFARLYMERDTINVVTMKYKDLAAVLREMNTKAREYIEKNW